jgi:hypothetical protein
MQQPQGIVYAAIGLEGAYRLYSRIAAIGFALITVYPVLVKLLEQRLAQDWLHSVLHLGSALLAAYAGWFAINILWAKGFTWAVGFLYLALGVYGWLASGLFLASRFAIPLGVADNLWAWQQVRWAGSAGAPWPARRWWYRRSSRASRPTFHPVRWKGWKVRLVRKGLVLELLLAGRGMGPLIESPIFRGLLAILDNR